MTGRQVKGAVAEKERAMVDHDVMKLVGEQPTTAHVPCCCLADWLADWPVQLAAQQPCCLVACTALLLGFACWLAGMLAAQQLSGCDQHQSLTAAHRLPVCLRR